MNLNEIETELKRRGYVDIKFTWDPDVRSMPKEQVVASVEKVLTLFLEGKSRPMPPLNDYHLLEEEKK